MVIMSSRILGVDPIACRAHGLCADEFPEAITPPWMNGATRSCPPDRYPTDSFDTRNPP